MRTHSCALPQWLDLFALHKLLQSPLTAGLPVALSVLERHHGFARTSGLGRTLRAVPRTPPPGRGGAWAVQLGVEGVGRVHLPLVPTARRFRPSIGVLPPKPTPRTGAEGSVGPRTRTNRTSMATGDH